MRKAFYDTADAVTANASIKPRLAPESIDSLDSGSLGQPPWPVYLSRIWMGGANNLERTRIPFLYDLPGDKENQVQDLNIAARLTGPPYGRKKEGTREVLTPCVPIS